MPPINVIAMPILLSTGLSEHTVAARLESIGAEIISLAIIVRSYTVDRLILGSVCESSGITPPPPSRFFRSSRIVL